MQQNIIALALALLVALGFVFVDELQAFVGTDEERCAWAEQKFREASNSAFQALWQGYRDSTCRY